MSSSAATSRRSAHTSAPSPVGEPAVLITSSREPGTLGTAETMAPHSLRWFAVPGHTPSSSTTDSHGNVP